MFKKNNLLTWALVILFLSATAGVSAEALTASQTTAQIVELQKLLAAKGFYGEDIDGVFGIASEMALTNFQAWAGLPITGKADKQSFGALRKPDVAPDTYSRVVEMSATAFSPEETSGRTCRGHRVRKGLVSVDTSFIPLGTRLYITGYGYAIADDTGSAMSHNVIDLGFDKLSEAMAFGRRDVQVYIF